MPVAWRPATAREEEEELVFGLRPHPHRWWRKIYIQVALTLSDLDFFRDLAQSEIRTM